MILQELDELCDAAKEKNWEEFLLEWVDVLYLVCNLAQEVPTCLQVHCLTKLSRDAESDSKSTTDPTYMSQRQ